MNTSFVNQMVSAEGRYLADLELTKFHCFIDSYTLRVSTYNSLQEHGDSMILQALRNLMPSNRQVIQKNSDLCKRDMSYVLRYAALSILKDDEKGFVEELVLWMQNILFALHKEDQSVQFYSALRDVINETMAPDEAALIHHYLTIFIDALKAGKR
jgi:hypothetical protein